LRNLFAGVGQLQQLKSSCGLPVSCRPMGKPRASNPTGTPMQGKPTKVA